MADQTSNQRFAIVVSFDENAVSGPAILRKLLEVPGVTFESMRAVETFARLTEEEAKRVGEAERELAVLKKDGAGDSTRRIAGQALEVMFLMHKKLTRSPVETTEHECPGCHGPCGQCDEEKPECDHPRSELLARKGDQFEMRKCLDCTKIFRVRLSVKASALPTQAEEDAISLAKARADGTAERAVDELLEQLKGSENGSEPISNNDR